MNLDAMNRFFRERRGDLMQIVRASSGELEEGDVQNTAYEIAVEIQSQRGYVFDFDCEADRTQLLRWAYARLVKFADKHLRFAISLDEQPDDERPTQASVIARGIKAHESSDPAVLLERAEQEREAEEDLATRYSELVAYLLLFRRFDTRKRLAAALQVTTWTLRYRLRRAERRSVHASLFDGIARIDADFHPTITRRMTAPAAVHLAGEQGVWSF